MTVELRLFGSPRVRVDGVDVRFDTRKAVALLAVLGATGREHSRDALAAMLWPDLDRVRARATLRRTLSVATAIGPALEVTAAGVRLADDDVWCDVREFTALAHGPDAADWARAADLAVGPFMEGFALRDSPVFDEWQIERADALRDIASTTFGRLVRDAVARGDLAAALEHARARTHVDPLSEPAHADLIRVTAWNGDRPGALTAYRTLVRLLDRELGVPPLAETRALHEAVRAGTLGPPSGGAVRPTRRAVGPDRAPDAARPLAPGRALSGRAAESRRLAQAWRSGSAAIGVVGDHGMGKTALLGAFSGEIDADRVVRLAGRAAERSLAFAVANDFVRALLSAAPDLVDRLGAAGRPLGMIVSEVDADGDRRIRNPGDLQRVHEAVRAALAAFAAGRRVLVVIDDAEQIDMPSAALLAYVVRRAPAGVLFAASWAPGDGRSTAVAEAVAGTGEVIALGPLDAAGVAEVLGDAALDPDEVLRRTRGVPLLVSEYARAGSADAGDVREVVAARFDAASATTRQVVATAAVIGTLADPELIRVACGRDEGETVDAIDEALARGLLVEQGRGYDVPHELVRDAALQRLSLARVRLLHGRVADLLARRHAANPLGTPAGAVARHCAAAARDEDASAWYLRAAEAATALSAHPEALEHLRAALAFGYRPLEVHERIGRTLVRLGRYDDALVSLDRAVALADDAGREAAIEHVIAGVYDRLGDPVLTRAHLEAARDLTGETAERARILADLALAQHRSGTTADARRTAQDAADLATRLGDRHALTQARNVLGVIATARGEHTDAVTLLEDASAQARELGDLDLLVATLNNLARAQAAAGAAEDALRCARAALAEAERQGDRHRLAALHSHLADLLHALGRDDEAVASLKSSASAFAQLQDARSRPEVWTLTEW